MASNGTEVASGYVSLYARMDSSNVRAAVSAATSGLMFQVGADTTPAVTALSNLSATTGDAGNALSLISLGMGAIGTKIGKFVVDTAGNAEQVQIAFTNMLGSAGAAKDMMHQLADFAIKTPFTFPTLAQSARQLTALGVSGDQVIPIMTAVGNAAAGLGLGDEGVKNITYDLGRMNSEGKVNSRLMMELGMNGVKGWQYLANYLNTDIPNAMKMVQAGEVDAQTGMAAMVQGMQNDFGQGEGMMAAQAKTLSGVFSNLADAIYKPTMELRNTSGYKAFVDSLNSLITPLQTLMTNLEPLGSTLMSDASVMVKGLSDTVGNLGQSLANMPTDQLEALVAGLGAFVALGPSLKIFSAGTSILSKFTNVMGAPFLGILNGAKSGLGGFFDSVSKYMKPGNYLTDVSSVSGAVANYFMSVRGNAKLGLDNIVADGKRFASTFPNTLFAQKIQGSKIAGMFSGLGSVLKNTILAPLAQLGPQALGALGGFSGIIGSAIGKGFSLFGQFSGAAVKAGTALGAVGIAATIAGVMFNQAGGNVQFFLHDLDGIVENGADLVTGMINSFTSMLPQLSQQLAAGLPGIINAVHYAISEIVAALMNNQQDFLNCVVQIAVAIGTMIIQNAPMLLSAALQLFAGLVQGLAQIIQQLTPQLPTFIQQIVQAIVANAPAILQAGVDLFVALVNAFATILPVLIQQIPVLVQALVNEMPVLMPELLNGAVTLFSAIVDAIPQILEYLLPALGSLIESAAAYLPTFLGLLGGAALSLFQAIVNAVGSLVGSLLGAIGDMLGQALNAIKNFNLFDAGCDFIQGFINGIGSMANELWNVISSTFSDVIGWAKHALGIASPSRIMKQIGVYTMQGFAIGINDASAQAVDAMKNAVGGIMDATDVVGATFGGTLAYDFTSGKAMSATPYEVQAQNSKNAPTIVQKFETKVVRSNEDLYSAAPIIYRNAIAEAREVTV